MEENLTSTNDENTFWNYLLLIILIIIIWYVFFGKKENFSQNDMKSDGPESRDRAMKIIQKINKTAMAMGDNDTDLKPNLNDNTDYKLEKDSTFPNLGSTKPFESRDMRIKYASTGSNVNKTANGSTQLMNQIGFINGEPVACNMLGVNSANMDAYKKKFYSMYAHQIECPAKCGLKADGMSKGCGMGSKCGLGPNCSNVNTNTSIPDTFALNYLALDNANQKPCVTCNFKPTSNPLNREWMEREYPSYDGLPEDVRIADEARLKKMSLVDANVSNYANFKDNVFQDSIGESAPDKINEIRTCQDAYGTCSLKDFGSSIATAYDKLTANPAYTSRNNCNPYQLTGILEDAASTDMYANI
jgi:hypothetical protein